MGFDKFFQVDFWEVVVRTVCAFIALLFLARMMGREQISQLTFFHYVTGISIGSIAGEIAWQTKSSFMNGIIAIVLWALLTVLLSYLTLKFKKVRSVIEGKPIIAIRDGKIMEDSLRKARIHLNELNMMLREQNIFSIKEVQYAILETNGSLSVLKRTDQEPATKKDVKASVAKNKYIPTEIISDSTLILENLQELQLTEKWVYDELKKQGIGNLNQVLYAQLQSDGTLYVDMKSENEQT